ncbi:MAG: major facilitator superfamily 1 [Myxococcales bacterium]|nr:major facilitator superfamily 1 [Myxococcales bacterium]
MTEKLKLPRSVWLLGGVSFFADVSGEMIYPLLPMFVVIVLGATATAMGWIEGVAQAVIAFVSAYAGVRSDKFRRRLPWVRLGYGLPVIGKAILAMAVSWPMVLIGRTTDRIGKGFRSSPRDALIADAAPEGMRGRAFGLHRAMDSAGAVVGVIVSAILLWWLGGAPGGAPNAHGAAWPYRVIFAIAAMMGVAAVALTFLIKEPAAAPATRAAKATPAVRAPLPRSYWVVLGLLLVFAIANSSDTFLLLRAANVGLSPWAVVFAYATYNVIYTVISYPAGALSDRFGRWSVIGAGWVIYAGVYAGFAVATPASILPLFGVYGLYMALTDGVGKALIADHAPKDQRGRALGIFYLATGFATIASSVVAGILWDRVGVSAPFWLGAAASALAVVILPFASHWSGRPSQ